MTSYLPYIFGISKLIAGIYLFLLAFGIYKPNNTKNKESFIEKYRTLFKIISIIVIFGGVYNLVDPNPDRYKISHNTYPVEWTAESKDILNKNCLRDSGPMAEKYPAIMQEYAECTTEIIMAKFNQKEYLEITDKPIDEQKTILIPLIKDCLAAMNRKVDSVKVENQNVR